MEWFKKHTDTVIILGAFAASMIWMNGKFSEIDKRFSEIEKEVAVIKAVMIMQKIMPVELAESKEKKWNGITSPQ